MTAATANAILEQLQRNHLQGQIQGEVLDYIRRRVDENNGRVDVDAEAAPEEDAA
jgi:hypothetical protein